MTSSFKIMSFNVNGLPRLDNLAKVIENHKPDLIGLQETKVSKTKNFLLMQYISLVTGLIYTDRKVTMVLLCSVVIPPHLFNWGFQVIIPMLKDV